MKKIIINLLIFNSLLSVKSYSQNLQFNSVKQYFLNNSLGSAGEVVSNVPSNQIYSIQSCKCDDPGTNNGNVKIELNIDTTATGTFNNNENRACLYSATLNNDFLNMSKAQLPIWIPSGADFRMFTNASGGVIVSRCYANIVVYDIVP